MTSPTGDREARAHAPIAALPISAPRQSSEHQRKGIPMPNYDDFDKAIAAARTAKRKAIAADNQKAGRNLTAIAQRCPELTAVDLVEALGCGDEPVSRLVEALLAKGVVDEVARGLAAAAVPAPVGGAAVDFGQHG